MADSCSGQRRFGSRDAASPGGWLLKFLVPLLLCGCAGAPPDERTKVFRVGENLLQEGVAAYRKSDYPTSISMFQKALVHYQSIDDIHGITRSRINLAEVALAMGNHDSAQQQSEDARQLVDLEGLEQYRSRLDLLRANRAIRAGDYVSARALLETLLPASGGGVVDNISLSALANRTRLAFDSDSGQAEQWTRRYAGELDKKKEFNPVLRARLYRFQAALARQHEEYSAAEQLYRQAHSTYQQVVYRPGIAATLEEWAELKTEQRDWGTARDLLNRALTIRIRILDRKASLEGLRRLSEINRQLGDQDRADTAGEWIRIIEKEDFEGWARLKEKIPHF
ncbi:MAG: tetratricopeptide repeat protein [Gammaproteobacteria bacterium]|nr:tetratricopeptide repeat protein [Gammaproteobacteria bacterium]